jgi:hypothetical protein
MTRAEALHAANDIIALYTSVADFLDAKAGKGVFVNSDSSAALALSETVWKSVRLLMDAAFSLPLRKTMKLSRDRQVIELCAEFYGSVDNAAIDEFILENNLNADEIGLIPMGREVSYYVQSA